MKARFNGTCAICYCKISAGQDIRHTPGVGAAHSGCFSAGSDRYDDHDAYKDSRDDGHWHSRRRY